MDEITDQDSYRTYNRDGFFTIVKLTYKDGEIDKVEGPVFPLAADVEGLIVQLNKMQQAFATSPLNADLLDEITEGKVSAAFLDGDGVPSRDPAAIEEDGTFSGVSDVVSERNVVEEEQTRASISEPVVDEEG